MKKSLALLLHFWVRPLNRAHTFWANGHSHMIWCTVSGCWRQMSHRVSTLTRRWCSLSLVGRQFEQALQRNILTFSGTFKVQTLFQVGPSPRAAECSAQVCVLVWRATWYAVLTENFWAAFSVHINVSWDCKWLSGIVGISSHVLWLNMASSFPRSHCLVSSSMSSQTLMSKAASVSGIGVCVSHLWVYTPIVLPLPTRHFEPLKIMSLAAKRLL